MACGPAPDFDVRVRAVHLAVEDVSSGGGHPASEIVNKAAAEISEVFKYLFIAPHGLRKKPGEIQRQPEKNTVQLVVTGVYEENVDAAIGTLPFRQ